MVVAGTEAVEDADVLVVEVDVDVAIELAVVAKQLLLGARVSGGKPSQDLADIGAVESRLEAEIARVVPGADGIYATVEMSRTGVTARAAIRWRPPGPDLMPITIHAASTAAVVVPP